MRISDTDIFILPGYSNSGEDHWQTRWERQLSTAQRIVQDDWHNPRQKDWTDRIVKQVSQAQRPAVLVAHSLGVLAAFQASHNLPKGIVKGAFLVAPVDLDSEHAPESIDRDFAHSLERPLPFPSVLVASQDDHYCSFDQAMKLAGHWGAEFTDAGNVGHLNMESGHGPWPEGLMRFAGFLKKLG